MATRRCFDRTLLVCLAVFEDAEDVGGLEEMFCFSSTMKYKIVPQPSLVFRFVVFCCQPFLNVFRLVFGFILVIFRWGLLNFIWKISFSLSPSLPQPFFSVLRFLLGCSLFFGGGEGWKKSVNENILMRGIPRFVGDHCLWKTNVINIFSYCWYGILRFNLLPRPKGEVWFSLVREPKKKKTKLLSWQSEKANF